jgi:hypothetical protein
MLSPGLCMAMVTAENLAAIIPGTGGLAADTEKRLEANRRNTVKHLSAWQELVDYFYDGRIFALQRTGMTWMKTCPGRISNIMQRHFEKNISGMAAGAYTTRPYSRWLLRFMTNYMIRDFDPKDFAIR